MITDPKSFLKNVLEYNSPLKDIVLIEGIRHQSILQQLKIMNPASYFIFLDVPQEERFKRYNLRKSKMNKILTFEEFKKMDNHPVEKDINSLKEHCHWILKDLNKDYLLSIKMIFQQKGLNDLQRNQVLNLK